jgi:HEAT repeat protein
MRGIWFVVVGLLVSAVLVWAAPPALKGAKPADVPDDVQAAIKRLRSPDPVVRRQAANDLGQKGYRAAAAIPFLASLLEDKAEIKTTSESPAQAAAEALALTKELAIPSLTAALQSKSPEVRKRAAWALGEIWEEEATGALLSALRDPDAAVRAEVLGALRGRRPPGIMEALLPFLHDPAPEVRVAAVRTVAACGDDRSVEPLLAVLKDPDPDVRAAAIRALPQLGDSRAVEPLLAALKNPTPDLRAAAVAALVASYDRRAKEPVLAMLHDPSPVVRRRVVDAIGGSSSRRLVDLQVTATRDEDEGIRCAALSHLENLLESLGKRKASVRQAFTAALKDGSPSVRQVAVGAVAQLGPADTVDLLLPMLRDPDPYVRTEAIECLSGRRDERIPAALRAMEQDPNRMVQGAAREARWQAPKEESLEMVVAKLDDTAVAERVRAARLLEEYEEERTIAPLLAHVTDHNAQARAAIISALRVYTDPEAAAAVKAALEDSDVRVRQAAAAGFSASAFGGGMRGGGGGMRGGGGGGLGGGAGGWMGGD